MIRSRSEKNILVDFGIEERLVEFILINRGRYMMIGLFGEARTAILHQYFDPIDISPIQLCLCEREVIKTDARRSQKMGRLIDGNTMVNVRSRPRHVLSSKWNFPRLK